MIKSIQRGEASGLQGLMRYGVISAVIGTATLAGFLMYSFVESDPRMANLVLALGVMAQWIGFLLVYWPARNRFQADAALGWDAGDTPKAFVAAAIGESGWIFVFASVMLAAFQTGSLELLGFPVEAIVVAAVIGILLPGMSVLMTVMLSLKGGQNA